MNLKPIIEAALGIYENYEKIEYYNFLESIKTSRNEVLVESIQNAFKVIYEDSDDGESQERDDLEVEPTEKEDKRRGTQRSFDDWMEVSNSIRPMVQQNFTGSKGSEITKLLMQILKQGQGKIANVKYATHFGNLDLVKSFNIVSGASDATDKENAKSILFTSLFPRIVYLGIQIGRKEKYSEFGRKFIILAISGNDGSPKLKPVDQRIDDFIDVYDPSRGGTLFTWDNVNLYNLRKYCIAEAEGLSVASKVWNDKTDYDEGIIVNHGDKNWEAVRKTAKGEEPGKSTAWKDSNLMGSKMSFDAPVQNGEDDASHTTVGDTVSSERDTAHDTEVKATLSKMLSKLPKTPETELFMKIINLHYQGGEDYKSISKELGVDAGAVFKKGMQTLRNIHRIPEPAKKAKEVPEEEEELATA